MNEPVRHKAEVALEFHDKRDAETFEETFDFALFAQILDDLANTAVSLHREALRAGAKALNLPLGPGALREEGEEELTPDLEVRLLHLLD
jgi:hypothetical protein